MWEIQLSTGEYIDLPSNFGLSLELNNLVFSGSDAGTLPGSYSFPAEAPLTGKNMRIFDRPHLPTSAPYTRQIDGVTVLAYGVPIMQGRITVLGATDTSVKFSILGTPITDLKDKELQSIDTEGLRSLVPYTMAGLMGATCDSPEDYDFAFLHAFTGKPWLPTETNDDADYQNLYDSGTQAFLPDSSGGITPFLKLEYVLERIFANEKNGYTFLNGFQDSTEIRRIYLYNNVDARVREGGGVTYPSQLDLNKHLPKMKVTDLLKKVAALFNLGIYVNYTEKTIQLLPVNVSLQSAAWQDWSKYAGPILNVEYATDAPGKYVYDPFEVLPASAPPVETMRHFVDYATYYAVHPVEQEYIYIESMNMVWNTKWNFVSTGINNLLWGAYDEQTVGTGGNTYNPGIVPLPGGLEYYRTDGAGISKFEQDGTNWRFVNRTAPLALMLYRGRQRADRFPCCGNTPYFAGTGTAGEKMNITTGPGGTVEAQATKSLNWAGDGGLYNTYHAAWNTVLRTGRHVTQSFAIPVGVLSRFSFDKKIRVGSLDYIIKKIRVGKLSRGHAFCEVSMVSVV